MFDNQEQRDSTKLSQATGLSWRKLLLPPVLPDEEQRGVARLLYTILLILVAGTIAVYLTAFSTENPLGVLVVVSALLAVEVVSFILLRLGKVRLAAGLLVVGLWLALLSTSVIAAGVSNSPFIAMLLVIVIAGLLLGGRAGQLFAVLNVLAGLGLLYLEANNLLPQPLIPFNLVSFWLSLSVVFLAVAGLISLAMRDIRETLRRARASERAQIEINRELQAIRKTLEEQIVERTQDLEQRTNYLQASFEVSRAVASILNTDQLIRDVVNLIREQFNLYYVGLFLTDASGEWAILRAGTGLAGKVMLERQHRIRVGSGMVGWCIANAQPRVALEAGADAVRLATPELPETRAEAAIPLFSRGKILGALSVQSTRPNAFGDTEITAFQAMADQVAIAINNANLFAESRTALEETQRAYGEISRRAWQEFLHQGADLSYRYDNGTILSIASSESKALAMTQAPQMRRALMNGEPWQTMTEQDSAQGKKFTLFLPIMVRDQLIGVIDVSRQDTERPWSDQEISLLRTIIDQLGVALDSARLYRDTQRLAYREQLTSEVTTRIRETLDIETVLRTAVQEVQKIIGAPEVVITLKTVEDGASHSNVGVKANRSESEPDGHKRSPGDSRPDAQPGDLSPG
ncbi:MAG: GAF domain-containing protein [Anaerolineales bacterium]|nr:GAF domain-containing protein [Anaerolineales bacterium]